MEHAFDPELAPWLPLMPPLDVSDVPAARELLRTMRNQRPPVALPGEVRVRGGLVRRMDPPGGVPVLIFTRDDTTTQDLVPAMVYLHGGGFVLGDADSDQLLPAQLCAETGAVIISVDYRLAPEHPFPAALDDCLAVLTWASSAENGLGVDPERIAIGGTSAGAGLAAAVSLMARDRGGPSVCFQLLDIPVIDDCLDSPSMNSYESTPMWNRTNAIASWRHYLAETEGPVPAYAAPGRATDLRGLPPTYISVCEFDPLRDEGLEFAARLVRAGVSTELHMFPGTFHGSSGAIPQAAVSRRMRTELINALRRGLGG